MDRGEVPLTGCSVFGRLIELQLLWLRLLVLW